MQWRLGLDVGTNSLGWAALSVHQDGVGEKGQPNWVPDGLMDAGVRIFSDARDPQSKESLAATRREPRGARRNRDRYLRRRQEFMDRLVQYGLMPKDKAERKALEKLDPWALRVRGLDEPLSLHELGRALFHLQQRRGFKSNRKTDRGDKESGAIKEAAKKLQEAMQEAGARTLGEYLGRPRLDQQEQNARLPEGKRQPLPGARARPTLSKGKNSYDFYPTRAMVSAEFDALWAKQKEFHGDALSDAAYAALGDPEHGTLFFQRPLKPQPVGKCTLDPREERAPKALPSVQRQRIYQEVNHLRLRRPGEAERPLSIEERNAIAVKLLSAGTLSFDSMRRLIKQPDVSFSHESKKRKGLDGDKTAAVMTRNPTKRNPQILWGKGWRDLPLAQQDAIVEILIGMEPVRANGEASPAFEAVAQSIAKALDMPLERARTLLSSSDEAQVGQWLMEDYGFDEARAGAIARANLPDGHGNLGRTATTRVLEQLLREDEATDPKPGRKGEPRYISAPFTYDQAARLAGYEHSDFADGEVFDQLPYYGEVLERHVAFGSGNPKDIPEKRYGRLANPTVHVAMNQIRKVVNALAKRYGPPVQIAVEMARDLPLSAKGKKELEKRQSENQKDNERIAAELEKHGQSNTYENRLRFRLWEELNQSDPLNRCCVYTGEQIGIEMLFTDAVEIEHILPRSKTLDDGFANKTVSLREANRVKGDRTPYEAFGNSPGDYDWDAISARAAALPPNKQWRFGPDAMKKYDNEERDFLARQLVDTRNIARLARAYLTKMAGPYNVWVTPGRLTSDLRHAWGLNSVLAGHNRAETEAGDVKKNRNDHRHHALDATVIALTDRALLQRVTTAAGKADSEHSLNWVRHIAPPWDGFRDEVMRVMDRITVSHKPDHGLAGELHEGTYYGRVTDPASGEMRLVTRKALTSLTEGEMSRIGDLKIRAELAERIAEIDELGFAGKDRDREIKAMLGEYAEQTGVQRVRVFKVQADYEIIRHNGHEKAVIPGENYCVDLVETPDGKWHGVGVTRFEANRQKRLGQSAPLWQQHYPDARHIMRVHKGDLLKLEKDGREQVMQVRILEPSANRFRLALHSEGGVFADRHKDKSDPFLWDWGTFSKLKARKARRVYVDPAGRLFDPGPPQ